MTVFYAACTAIVFGAAFYMLLARNLVRMLLGLALLSTAVNLLLFLAGDHASRQPPIVAAGRTTLGPAADPLAQALILTAIVIGLALTVVLAVLVLRAWGDGGSLDSRDLDRAEDMADRAPALPPAAPAGRKPDA